MCRDKSKLTPMLSFVRDWKPGKHSVTISLIGTFPKDFVSRCYKFCQYISSWILHVLLLNFVFPGCDATHYTLNYIKWIKKTGAVSSYGCRITSIGIPMLKIRRSRNRLIFNLGILIPGKTVFIFKRAQITCSHKFTFRVETLVGCQIWAWQNVNPGQLCHE